MKKIYSNNHNNAENYKYYTIAGHGLQMQKEQASLPALSANGFDLKERFD